MALPPITAPGAWLARGGKPFFAFGFNYGFGDLHPFADYLDYPSDANLKVIKRDFAQAKALGANTLRVRIEPQQILDSPTDYRTVGPYAVRQVLNVAEANGLYLDVTGLFSRRALTNPVTWYDNLTNFQERWDAQATFWRGVARACATSSAVLQYELVSEPQMPSAPPSATWYGTDPEIDYAQPQFIVKDPGGETPSDLAKMWIALMVKQVRRYDPDRLISFGSLPVTATANYAFAVEGTAPLLGVVTPHLYPKTEVGLDSAVATLRRFSMTGKPVILGETFQLHSSWQMVSDMLVAARSYLDGVFVYFDGRTADEARDAEDTLSGMYANALDGFTALRSTLCQNRCGVY